MYMNWNVHGTSKTPLLHAEYLFRPLPVSAKRLSQLDRYNKPHLMLQTGVPPLCVYYKRYTDN